MAEHDVKFLDDLQALADSIQPDTAFVNQLEGRLQAAQRDQRGRSARRLIFGANARKMLAIAASLVVVSAFLLSAPAIRSLAQDVLEYFRRGSSETITVPPVSAPTEDEAPLDVSVWLAGAVTVAEAEQMVGFTIALPVSLPEGYALAGAKAHPDGEGVRLEFWSPPGRGLTITEWGPGVDANANLSRWEEIPPSATVQIVSVNGARAEYVAGGWGAYPDATEALWMDDVPIRRLRWQVGDQTFEIVAMGGSYDGNPSYLGQADMIALAESTQ